MRAVTDEDIATPKSESQLDLWGEVEDPKDSMEMTCYAKRRYYIGEAVENLVDTALGTTHIGIDGRKPLCPDSQFSDGNYLEIKACLNRSKKTLHGKTIIYSWRLQKERAALASECVESYSYGFLEYTTDLSEVYTLGGLRRAIVECNPTLYLLPIGKVWETLSKIKPRKFSHIESREEKSNLGFHKGGYDAGGWNPTLKVFLSGYLLPMKRRRVGIFGTFGEVRICDPFGCLP